MNLASSSENEQFVQQEIAKGTYLDQVEALNAGLDLLRERMQLVARLEESRRQLDHGEFTEFDGSGLRELFEDLKRRARGKVGATGE